MRLLTVVHDNGSATFGGHDAYRYRLTREWEAAASRICWLLLNPSTATARQDDSTVRRVVDFSRQWGFGSVVVVNLFALRTADPVRLRSHPDPVGPDNDEMLVRTLRTAEQVVVAWGNNGTTVNPATSVRRDREVNELMAGTRAVCLGHTKTGQPRHPLYLPRSTRPIPFRRATSAGRLSSAVGAGSSFGNGQHTISGKKPNPS